MANQRSGKKPFTPVVLPRQGEDLFLDNDEILALMREVLAKGAAFRFRAKGTSMSPFIRHGDWITVLPLDREPLAIGKVAAFIHPEDGRLIVHRLIEKNSEVFSFRGDNSISVTEKFVNAADVLGCVTRVERDGRTVYSGLGIERQWLAFLSKNGWLVRGITWLRKIKARLFYS